MAVPRPASYHRHSITPHRRAVQDHAMTRRLPLLLAAVATTLTSLVVVALPALATDGEEVAAGGFGTGQWDGVILAAIVGLVFAIAMFADADPGGIPGPDDHHDH